MGDQGPALDPTVVAGGGGAYLNHADGLDAHAKALAQLQSLRAAFAGSAARHWPAVEAALTGAGGQLQAAAQSYAGIGQGMRNLADGVASTDAVAGQGISSSGQGGDPR